MYFTTGRGNQSALNRDPLGTLNEPLPGALGNTGTGAFIFRESSKQIKGTMTDIFGDQGNSTKVLRVKET